MSNHPVLLHDMEHYIRSNGIESGLNNERRSSEVEAEDRAREEQKYQDTVHNEIFGESPESDRTSLIASYEDIELMIETSDGKCKGVPLKMMATKSETVFRLANSRSYYGKKGKELKLSLVQFDYEAVNKFLTLLLNSDQSVENIPSDYIIECCRIADFLQCQEILEKIVAVIDESIDAENCISIFSLAGTLNLDSLFESALSQIVSNFDRMENNEYWDDIPQDLQHRILTMKNAISSSILARGQRSKVFFSSSDEFLAIMSDNIRDQRERLTEAKKRLKEVTDERQNRERYGFLVGRDPLSGSILDAAEKIKKQEQRVKTLESFYIDQKRIFSSNIGLGNDQGCNQLVL